MKLKTFALLGLLVLPFITKAQTPVASVTSQASNYTDSTGQIWTPQTQCSSKNEYLMNPVQIISGTLPGPTDQKLYNAETYGPQTCNFPVAPGTYTVLFKFAEIYYGSTAGGTCTPPSCAGMRVFNVSANGVVLLSNFDIAAAAGGPLKAIDKSFTVTAGASGISIVFTPTATSPDQNPKWDSIQITPQNAPPPTGNATLSLSGTNPSGATVTQVFDPSKAISATFQQPGGFQVIGGTVVPLTISTTAPGSGQGGTAVSLTGTGFVGAGMTGGLVCPSGTSGTFYPFTSITYVNSTHVNVIVPTLPSSVSLPVSCDTRVSVP